MKGSAKIDQMLQQESILRKVERTATNNDAACKDITLKLWK